MLQVQSNPDFWALIFDVISKAKALSDSLANLIITLVGLSEYPIPPWVVNVVMVLFTGFLLFEFGPKVGKYALIIMVILFSLGAMGLAPI